MLNKVLRALASALLIIFFLTIAKVGGIILGKPLFNSISGRTTASPEEMTPKPQTQYAPTEKGRANLELATKYLFEWDVARAESYAARAVETGDVAGKYVRAKCLELEMRLGKKRRKETGQKIAKLLYEACGEGHADSCGYFSVMLFRGSEKTGKKEFYKTARSVGELACANGSPEGCLTIYEMLTRVDGKSFAEAKSYMEKACRDSSLLTALMTMPLVCRDLADNIADGRTSEDLGERERVQYDQAMSKQRSLAKIQP